MIRRRWRHLAQSKAEGMAAARGNRDLAGTHPGHPSIVVKGPLTVADYGTLTRQRHVRLRARSDRRRQRPDRCSPRLGRTAHPLSAGQSRDGRGSSRPCFCAELDQRQLSLHDSRCGRGGNGSHLRDSRGRSDHLPSTRHRTSGPRAGRNDRPPVPNAPRPTAATHSYPELFQSPNQRDEVR